MLAAIASRGLFTRLAFPRAMSAAAAAARKPGVATIDAVRAQAMKDGLVVVDVRNPDPSVEFEGTAAGAPLPDGNRPAAVNAVWNREEATLDMTALDGVAKDAPIITH